MTDLLLLIHILFGSLALVGGAIAIFARKGNGIHRKGGGLFTYSMVITALSAIALSLIRPNTFLMAIGFFTLYLTFSGWVWVMRIQPIQKERLHVYIAVFGLCSGLFLLIKATSYSGGLPYVLLVFGGIQLIMALSDLIIKSKQHIIMHISKIGGAYISAITAFLVVNIDFLPAYLTWLGPTVAGTVLISMAIRKLRIQIGLTKEHL